MSTLAVSAPPVPAETAGWETPLVSILIPCFNAERWIAEAIESAIAQTHPRTEVIVVDDGSTDNSLEVIRSYSDRIRWETGPNRGGNVARNRLLELAQGEWLQYLDADDYLLPDKITTQLEEAGPREADLLWSPSIFEHWQADGQSRQETQDLHEEDPWAALIRWRLPQTGAALWRTAAVESCGGWKPDQPRCQEHELYFRMLSSGSQFHFCPSARSVYRQWSTQTVCRRNPLATTITRMQIVDQIERHLRRQQLVTGDLSRELLATRVQCARSIWPVDRGLAKTLMLKGRRSASSLCLPAEPWFPLTYRLIFAALGFEIAEQVASCTRLLRRTTTFNRRCRTL